MKRFISILLTLTVLFCLPLTAYAHDAPEARTDCTIEVILWHKDQDISGGTLTVIRVGYVDEEDGNYFFSRILTKTRIEDIQSPTAASELLEFYRNNRSNYAFYKQTAAVSQGKAKFTALPTGLYLVIQEKAAEGYSEINPFLVSLPYMEDGEYKYDLTATNKPELEPEVAPTTEPPPEKPTDPTLPQTGQMNWPVPLLAVSGIALFLLGWFLRFGRKKESYEE